ncbi:YesK family protein [Terribacillus saccharophilus]|uniref:YesK family protein n=1 Tax=Terribacillus saccharophilus TaxID=361277 RepID=UPI002DC753DB|nr:YesK family protein [Terribacillus saccharophilus]
MEFWFMIIIFTALIIGISLFFKNKKPPVMYLIPSAFTAVSIVLLIASFIIGGFSGMGMIVFSIGLLISSAATLIVVSFYGFLKCE